MVVVILLLLQLLMCRVQRMLFLPRDAVTTWAGAQCREVGARTS